MIYWRRNFLPSPRSKKLPLVVTGLFLLLWLAPLCAAPNPVPSTATPNPRQTAAPSADEVEALIATLENDQSRAQLIAQLRLLIETEEKSKPDAGNATAEALRDLSKSTVEFINQFVLVAGGINQLPQIADWLQKQAFDAEQRRVWSRTLLNLALILSAGYAALFVLQLGLRKPRRLITEKTRDQWWVRLGMLLLTGLLDLIPIAGFAAAGYLSLGLVNPAEPTRLVALAWINAILLLRLVQFAGSLGFCADTPHLRLWRLDDESAHYAEIWIRRLARVGVYGYFLIQSAQLLGLPGYAFSALLRLLGLLMTALLLVLILQNRAGVAAWIRGPRGTTGTLNRLRSHLAAIWYIPAVVYLFVLYGIWALGLTNGFATLLRGTLLSLLALGIGLLLLRLLDRIFQRGLSLPEDLRSRFPGLQARSNRYLPALQLAIRILVYISVGLGLLQAWGLGGFTWVVEGPGRALASTAGSVVLIVVVALAIWELTSLSIETYLAGQDTEGARRVRSARSRTLLSVARTAVAVLVSVIATLLVLSQIGINIAPLLATAGVLGLAVGFGSQKLVQDLITGFFILLEDVFAVGDVIKVGDRAGLVEAVSIRNVRLRDLSGTVHTLPFSTITTISNLTKDFSYFVFDIGVAYREDVDQVIEVIQTVGAQMREDDYFGLLITDKIEVFGLDRFDDSAVVVKGRIQTLPIKQWEVGREFNRRIKQRFDALDIEIPFPHRTLYFGIDKEGGAPAAHLQMETAFASAGVGPRRQSPAPATPAVQPVKAESDKGSSLPDKDLDA
jgi:small-conductance mechanosensitive channel